MEVAEPVLNLVAEEGPLSELAATVVLEQLLDIVERRASFEVILPENVLLAEDGTIRLAERGPDAPDQRDPNCVFSPPECKQDGEEFSTPSAYVWNVVMLLYSLLSGYVPFSSTTASCPYYRQFTGSRQLTCPAHFSDRVISLMCMMLVVGPGHRASVAESRTECQAWKMHAAAVDRCAAHAEATERGAGRKEQPARKRAAAQGQGSSIRTLDQLGKLSLGSKLKSPAATAAEAAARRSEGGCSEEGGEDASREADLCDSPEFKVPAPPSATQRAHPATTMPPPLTAFVVGPHSRSPKQVAAGLQPHPNSPLSMSRSHEAAHRPTAVVYSPNSELPRKVTESTAAAWTTRGGPASFVPVSRRKPQVKRLGWDILAGVSLAELQAHLQGVLDGLGVEARPLPNQPLSLLTRPSNVSNDMGVGTMQALIVIKPPPDAVAEGPAGTFQVGVTRHAGDTFQFHAFYRNLRSAMQSLIGWTGSEYCNTTAATAPSHAHIAAPGAGA